MKLFKLLPVVAALVLAGCTTTPTSENTSTPDSHPSLTSAPSSVDPTSVGESSEVPTSETPISSEEPSTTISSEEISSEELSSEEPAPVDETNYADHFAQLDLLPEWHPINPHGVQTMVAQKRDNVLTIKVERRVNNPTADNANWWDDNQIDLFLDLTHDGGTSVNEKDAHFIIRPDGQFSFQVGSTSENKWQDFVQGSWANNGIFGMHVETSTPTRAYSNAYVAYVGINLAFHEFEVGEVMGVAIDLTNDSTILNPSIYQKLPVYTEETTFTSGSHEFADRTVTVVATPKAYNVTVSRTVSEFVDDLWNGASNLFLLFAGSGSTAGDTPSASDLKFITAHTGYSAAAVGTGAGWKDPWIPGSWSAFNTIEGGVWYSIAIDGNHITYSVSISLDLLGLSAPDTSVRLLAEAGPVENNPVLWQEITLD